jgi:2-methylisocitrate lyase-like PEP mutase family enzyme
MHSGASSAETFHALHRSGCFVMPNAWDVGSARYLEQLGFRALGTTSSGMALARGLPDSAEAITVDRMLEHVGELARATTLPLHADFQSGYARELEVLARNVARCVEAGAAGLSIEDASGEASSPLFEHNVAVRRIGAARAAIDATGAPALLTARCEAWLVQHPDPFRTALDRLVAFAEAGADCLFAPGVRDPEQIAALVHAVAPKPLNVIVSDARSGLSVARLADLGVRRISVGSALARVAWGAFARAARSIAETGAFDALAGAAPFAEPGRLFR